MVFNTDADVCETYGHDLPTGATYRKPTAQDPHGRAILRAAEYQPPEAPADYPLAYLRSHPLPLPHPDQDPSYAPANRAAPPDHGWSCPADAATLGIHEGDLACVESRRGEVEGRVRVYRTSARGASSLRSTTATSIARTTRARAPPTS